MVLAELAKGRLRSKIPALRGPLTGEFHVEQQMQTPCPWRWQAVAFFEPALWAEPTGAHTGRRRRVSVAVGCGETDFACRKRLCTGDSDSGLLKNILQVGGTGLHTLVMSLIDRHIERLVEDGRSIKTLDTYRYDARKLAKLVGGASRRSLASSVGRRTSLDAHHTWPNDGDLRSHLDDVVRPVLRFWRVFERDDLDRDGERARNDLAAFLDLVETRPHTTGNFARNGWPRRGVLQSLTARSAARLVENHPTARLNTVIVTESCSGERELPTCDYPQVYPLRCDRHRRRVLPSIRATPGARTRHPNARARDSRKRRRDMASQPLSRCAR